MYHQEERRRNGLKRFCNDKRSICHRIILNTCQTFPREVLQMWAYMKWGSSGSGMNLEVRQHEDGAIVGRDEWERMVVLVKSMKKETDLIDKKQDWGLFSACSPSSLTWHLLPWAWTEEDDLNGCETSTVPAVTEEESTVILQDSLVGELLGQLAGCWSWSPGLLVFHKCSNCS